MKLSGARILAKANLSGGEKKNTVLLVLLVIALTLISSYSNAVTQAVGEFKNDYRARALQAAPILGLFDRENLKRMVAVDHVESVAELKGIRSESFGITKVDGENEYCKELNNKIKNQNTDFTVTSLLGDEERRIISGSSLNDAPVYSCIIPSFFCPFETEDEDGENLDYVDSEALVGTTLYLHGTENIEKNFFVPSASKEIGITAEQHHYDFPSVDIALKVVGVYYASPTGWGGDGCIFVSNETGIEIMKKSMRKAGFDLEHDKDGDVMTWWNDPALHDRYVIVDDYDNIGKVYSSITEGLHLDVAPEPEITISESVMIMYGLLNYTGKLLIAVAVVLCIINLIQASAFALKNRRGEFGLMKAVGYKDRQIFLFMLVEQMYITAKAVFIGGAISALTVLATNYIFSHKTFEDRLYMISWEDFAVYFITAVIFAVLIPVVCQLITLKKLSKIQPNEAMKG